MLEKIAGKRSTQKPTKTDMPEQHGLNEKLWAIHYTLKSTAKMKICYTLMIQKCQKIEWMLKKCIWQTDTKIVIYIL